MPSHYRNSYENYYNAGNRPIPAGNPYGYGYFNPTGKEQAALTIGSLLSGVLAASAGQSKWDAVRKGIAGTMAGYGSGYQNYQNLMGDAFGRDLQTKSYGQRVKEYEDSMGLNREKFAEEKRQYEEAEKPERLARANYYNQREETPVDYNKIRDERVKRRLDIRAKRADLAKPIYAPGEEGRASFENINNLSDLPAEQLAAIRKTPEYVAALNAFIKPNIMAEPYTPDLGGDAKTPTKGLWESIKDRFSTSPQPDIISKGTDEALSNRRATPPSSIPEGTTGIDTSNNKKTIRRNGRWEYAD